MHAQTAIRTEPARRPAMPMRETPHALKILDDDTHTALDRQMQLMGAVISFPRNTEIFGENEPAEYLYKVISGAVRTYKILSDGRRQVGGFYMPGDIFGLEFLSEHALSAEAMIDTKVLVVKRSTLDALARRDAAVAQQLFSLTGRELGRVQDRVLLLIKNARERVASFLMEMAERLSIGNAVELPMSRQDIADYLGLTIETVSRTFTSLESCAAIEVSTSRHIVLRNRSALQQMTD